jgi:hypothetical protein
VANAVYAFSAGATAVVRPYLIGGVGACTTVRVARRRSDGSTWTASTGTKVGFNGGVGLEIPLSGITASARSATRRCSPGRGDRDFDYNVGFVPIRFGIRF